MSSSIEVVMYVRSSLIGLAAIALLAAAATVKVPYETPVTVHVKTAVSSGNAQPGESVVLEVADDVVANGYVVIAKGADGLASVDAVSPATSSASGQVSLTFRWVRAVDGSKIGVTGTHNATGRTNTTAADASTALFDTSSAAEYAGAGSAGGILASAGGVMAGLGGFGKHKDASVGHERTISLEVKNPNGVSIVSSQKSNSKDDSDVK